MLTVDLVAFAVLVALLVVAFVSILLRRRFLSRGGGSVELSFRLKTRKPARGWVLGVGRFHGDELQWFRVFSFSNRPRRTLSRRDLTVIDRRQPQGQEVYALLKGAEVLELLDASGTHQIALEPSAAMGFLSWLEARPPGATLPD